MLKTIKTGRLFAYMLGITLAAVLFIAPAVDAIAAPANPFPFEFEQENGQINLFFRGDEFFSWWEDENGFIVAYDQQIGQWRYAQVANGAIVPRGQIVSEFDPRLVNAAVDSAVGAGFSRIERTALLPIIENSWRFDPGDPTLEFMNGQIFRDHRISSEAPHTSLVPGALQPGRPINPPTVPTFPNVTLPGGGGAGGGDATQPPIRPPVVPPGGGGSIIGNLNGHGTPIFSPPSANTEMAAAASAAVMSHIQTNQRLLVILLEFDNMQMLQDSAFYHNKYFNTAPGAISIANYFRDMSGGRDIFIPAGNVTSGGTFNTSLDGDSQAWAAGGVDVTITPSTHSGIVHARLHMNHPITAWSVPAGHEAARSAISLALAAIHNNTDFNFDDVHVAVVLAGGEAADNFNPGGQVWAHAWQYRGAHVGRTGWPRYMVYGEQQRGGQVMGIGLAAHELGHVLGLPDLYDISGQSEGAGPYCLMAHGAWGRAAGDPAAGHRPTAMNSWTRMQLGYIQPTIVSSGTWRGNVNALGSNDNNVIMVTSPASNSQYFLIENRQTSNRWDAGMSHWVTNPDVTGGIMILHVDDAQRSANPSDMSMNNNNANHKMVGIREADGSSLLASAVARWTPALDHFFSTGSYNNFNAATNPNSNFHSGQGLKNTATGVEINVHGARGNSMEVEIVLEMSGGAAGPRIGAGGGAASAGANPSIGQDAASNAVAIAALNHARIQNQVAINANTPTITMPTDTTQIYVYGATLQMLASGHHDLAISGTRNVVLPPSFLSEILASGVEENTILAIRLTNVGSGVHIHISTDGRPLLDRRL